MVALQSSPSYSAAEHGTLIDWAVSELASTQLSGFTVGSTSETPLLVPGWLCVGLPTTEGNVKASKIQPTLPSWKNSIVRSALTAHRM